MNKKINTRKSKVGQIDILIGKELRRLREMKKMEQSELAKSLSIDKSSLHAYENGIFPVSAAVLFAICKVLEISVEDFYGCALGWNFFSASLS